MWLCESLQVGVCVCRRVRLSACQGACVFRAGGCVRRYVMEALPGANKPQWCNRQPAGPPEGKEGKRKHIWGLSLAHHKQALDSTAPSVLHSCHPKPCGLAWEGVTMEAKEAEARGHKNIRSS